MGYKYKKSTLDRLRYAKEQSFLSKLSNLFMGKPTKSKLRGEYDGPLHLGTDKSGNLHPDNLSRAYNERSAIAKGLRQLGHNPTPQIVQKYVNRMGHLIDNAPNHPLVKSYVDTASKLTAPSVVEGEHPSTFMTVSPKDEHLTTAALPLLRQILSADKSELSTVMDNLAKRREQQHTPIPSTSTKENNVEDLNFSMPEIRKAIDEPLPLPTLRGEKGIRGKRHKFIADQLEKGAKHEDIKHLLQNEFMLTPKQAAATFAQFKLKNAIKKIAYSRRYETVIKYGKVWEELQQLNPYAHDYLKKKLREMHNEHLKKGGDPNQSTHNLDKHLLDLIREGKLTQEQAKPFVGKVVHVTPSKPIKVDAADVKKQPKELQYTPGMEPEQDLGTPVKQAIPIVDPKLPIAKPAQPKQADQIKPIPQNNPLDEHAISLRKDASSFDAKHNSSLGHIPNELMESINHHPNTKIPEGKDFIDVPVNSHIKDLVTAGFEPNRFSHLRDSTMRIGYDNEGNQVPTHLFPKGFNPDKPEPNRIIPDFGTSDPLSKRHVVNTAVKYAPKLFNPKTTVMHDLGVALNRPKSHEGDPILHSIYDGHRYIYVPHHGNLDKGIKELEDAGHLFLGHEEMNQDHADRINRSQQLLKSVNRALPDFADPLKSMTEKARKMGLLDQDEVSHPEYVKDRRVKKRKYGRAVSSLIEKGDINSLNVAIDLILAQHKKD